MQTSADQDKVRIAVVEDSSLQAQVVSAILAQAGYRVELFENGTSFQAAAPSGQYGLLIFDWMLPDIPGPDLLTWAREQLGWDVPILFLTGRDEEDDIATVLSLGADDYMTKPLRPVEFLARVQALTRRCQRPRLPSSGVAFFNIRLDPETREAFVDEQRVHLPAKEFDLAWLLLNQMGTTLDRDFLITQVWGTETEVGARTVDAYFSRLRKNLGLTPEHGWSLVSVYGRGYRLERTR